MIILRMLQLFKITYVCFRINMEMTKAESAQPQLKIQGQHQPFQQI